MANTYVLIASNTLSSSAASVTFSAIPNTYTDLAVRISARTNTAYGVGGLYVKINGATSNSSVTRLYTTNGTSAASNRATTSFWSYGLNTDSQTASTFSSVEVYLPNYAASINKPFSYSGVAENNATAAAVNASAGLYSSNTVISSLVFESLGGDNFVSGSSFFLYGIKNS